jgi:hypothetical protein
MEGGIMTKVFLISEETIKKYSLVNNNVDGKYISSAIQAAQDIDLQTIIGESLVNRLCLLVETGDISNNTNYKLLLDKYITPYMIWQVMSTVQIGLNYKLVNSGVNICLVQRLANHRNISTTQRYFNYNPQMLSNAVESLKI